MRSIPARLRFRRAPRREAAALAAAVLAIAVASVASAQRVGERPVERERELRPLEPTPPSEPREPLLPLLPPVPPVLSPPDQLSGAPRVTVKAFRFTGNTVFSNEELAAQAADYVGKSLTSEQLEELRRRLTLFYVEAGYRNSGAVLPDQKVVDGIVEYQIVEGHLTAIDITGKRQFRDRYLRGRLDPGTERPLNVHDIEERLQLLLQDDRIERVDAQLGPGAAPGEARLHVDIEEARPWQALLAFDNHQPPSIGANTGYVSLAHRNLTGNGDVLYGSYEGSEGLDDFEVSYTLPFTRWDTALGARYEYSDSEVVEHPFDELDIESRFVTYELSIAQPVYRTLDTEVALRLAGEWRESRTYLLGQRFSFSPGVEDGKSVVSVLRFYQDWVYRSRQQVVAARSTFSWGLDALGATSHSGSTPDGQFVGWLGQVQWARRFDPWGVEAIFRADAQFSNNPLLPLEQYSVGGATSVRGYRENELVRDQGFTSSFEVRVPLWSAQDGRPILQLAPFVDVGRATNRDRDTPRPRTLSSVGIGLRCSPFRWLQGQLYYGYALRNVEKPEDDDLQDDGIHFQVELDLFGSFSELNAQLRETRPR